MRSEHAAAAVLTPEDRFEILFGEQFVTTVRLAGLLGADDPEDVAQEAFARLHARMAGLRQEAAAVAYVRLAAGFEEQRRVVAAVALLPPRQRAVVVLRYWADLSPPEVATTLGIPVGTVKSATARALKKIEAALEGSIGD